MKDFNLQCRFSHAFFQECGFFRFFAPSSVSATEVQELNFYKELSLEICFGLSFHSNFSAKYRIRLGNNLKESNE